MINATARCRTWSILSLALCLASCGDPPLRVRSSSGGVIVDVQTLGEYQTSVARIRLTDESTHEVVWEVVAKEGTPQIHQIELQRGVNKSTISDVNAGTFQTVVPSANDTFSLTEKHTFAITIWSPSGRSSGASFQL